MKIPQNVEKTKIFNAVWHIYRKIKNKYISRTSQKLIKLNENWSDQLTYNKIWPISFENKDNFFELLHKSQQNSTSRLMLKEKIKVGFLVYSSSIWQYEAIYRLMEKDERFEPIIIIVGLNDGTKNTIQEQYEITKSWFNSNDYRCIGVLNENKELDWKFFQLDIVFSAIPYINILPRKFEFGELPVSTLLIYTPYGVAVNEMSDRYFNMKIHNIAWRLFYETDIQKLMGEKYALNKGENIIVSGYSKIDNLLKKECRDYSDLWKGNVSAKKIIYAPHHSLMREESRYATFDENYLFILDYAKNHINETSWIIKPHPLLKKATIQYGLFSSEAEYDAYLAEWDNLPNAKVVLNGDYFDYFVSSDAMLLDSESFIFEYQYTHKPLLFFTRKTQTFNAFGEMLLNILYKCPGNDYDGISNFVDTVVINGNDSMFEQRQTFFNKYLNYVKDNNGMNASEYIYSYVRSQVTK